ncbi:MAG TPA: FMN-binding glutamate synthase family protein, partial [Pseudomonas sp.]|nr:FMN-binding glutamate synthase family protein [Pseudomonas sp.]
MLVIRYAVFATAIVGSLITLLLALSNPWWLLLSAVFIALTVLGMIDLRQTQSTLRRNYPIAA